MDNSEASLALRRNPLNIRASDGSDIVVGKTPRHAAPEMHDLAPAPAKALASAADFDFSSDNDNDNDNDDDDSVPTTELDDQVSDPLNDPLSDPLSALDIGAAPAANRASAVAPLSPSRLRLRASESMDLSGVDLDFGTDISSDLGGLLSRKNTIALRSRPDAAAKASNPAAKAYTGPSRDKQLIQRLRSIRKRLSSDSLPQVPDADLDDDARRAEGLPDDVLKMIAFSPDSPWLGSELHDSDSDSDNNNDNDNNDENINENNQIDTHNSSAEPADKDSSGRTRSAHELVPELNPFRVSRDPTPESAESLTPTSDLSAFSDSPASSPRKQPPRADGDGPSQRAAAPSSPRIEDTDPVKPEDRGRLFLQVNKLANVRGLPIDPARHPRFTLVLDNGIQTVTTEPTPLPSPGFNGLLTAKVGQEFELVVAQDLELVVTVNVQMDALQPPPRPVAPRISRHAPTDSIASTNTSHSRGSAGGAGGSGSGGGGSGGARASSPVKGVRNLLRSPKKKQSEKFKRQQQEREREEQRELELLERQQQQDEVERKRYDKDLAEFHRRADTWRNITGPGGEYCRGYLFESHYERDIYGAAKSFALPLYNEWDKASNGVPKPVCDLQITMMYVPKLYGSEHIPMSMKECQQELRAAAEKRSVGVQGFLTQQGGDCVNIWRRRWFTLQEAEMVGHHEATRKRRALIHLENAVAIKETLSEDLWCIYEDRSFEISFDDGEALSFYADSVEERDRWVAALRSSIANCTGRRRAWTDLVLARQAEASA